MDRKAGIDAYDLPARVASYDADMDVMHPNRHKMIEVALDFLPRSVGGAFTALDLGVGTGLFAGELLKRYPEARVVAVDGAEAMVDLARTRLGALADRVDFRVGDFRDLDDLLEAEEMFSVVISSYALHHLSGSEKEEVVRACGRRLRPGGCFLNADLIIGDSDAVEVRFQELRIDGILERAPEGDPRFADALTTRRFLDDLEEGEGDQPRRLGEDIDTMKAAGLVSVGAVWVEHREAVMVGFEGSRRI